MYQQLFSEKNIGNITVPNRIAMTAMGNHLANPDGTVSEADIAFYGARARGGVGLVITECACVDFQSGKGNLRQMAVDDDKYIEGLARLADEVHKYGSRIAVQIYHPGRQGIAAINGVDSMIGASDKECQCVHQPVHAMSQDEIREVTDRFAKAAGRIKQAGIDAVELHGAHGYLIGQFLSPYTNTRLDEYGGSFEKRMRFLDEIIDGVRKTCGDDYPLLVRFSVDEHMEYVGQDTDGIHLEEGVRIARHLEEKGVDALDVSCGIYETMNTAWEPVSFDQGWKIDGPAEVKKAVSIPVIGAAVIRDPGYAESLIEDGKLDFIGSARTFFADPEWAVKAKEGREDEIRKCISCLYCMETLMAADQSPIPMSCAINFEGCREAEYSQEQLKKDGAGRTVAVIGAGPAGMEAARVLALRGFKPVVYEKQDHVGGQICLAEKPPKKEKMDWLIEYQERQLEKLGVEVHLDQPADMDVLRELHPYAVVAAQGSHPVIPASIKGVDGEHVHTPVEILDGTLDFKDKDIIVVGSGMTGIETAELLAERGNQVSVFEMADEIGPGMFFQNLIDVMKRLDPDRVKMYAGHCLKEIHGNCAIFERTDTKEARQYEFDELVLSLGTAANSDITEELKTVCDKVISVGDALEAGRIEPAIRTGYLAAAELE